MELNHFDSRYIDSGEMGEIISFWDSFKKQLNHKCTFDLTYTNSGDIDEIMGFGDSFDRQFNGRRVLAHVEEKDKGLRLIGISEYLE